MSDTLVIHPTDDSTVMLTEIYKDKGFDVITDPDISNDELIKKIKSHSRIIMLGHGTPNGLIHPKLMKYGFAFKGRHYIIDDNMAKYLKDKVTIGVWCYANEYFVRNNLPGFHTGMIISERREAYYILGKCPLSDQELFNNMILFSNSIRDCIDLNPIQMKEYVLKHYVGDDEITRFNRQNVLVN